MLNIQNVHKHFGATHALNDINLELGPGLFGLLGPNGAGKSTLMRTLATLQNPDEGSITFMGENIVHDPDVIRRNLGYLPQDFGVYPRMSAEKLLHHLGVLKGLTNKAERQEQIDQLLEQVDLRKHRHASVASYSGGMRQRFGVAQAMLGDPKLLIVDEPTAGLDPFQRQRFLDLLSEAGEEKIIILSTHIVEDVRALCPDMAIMGDGKIVARGAPEALLEKIKGSVWRKTVDKAASVDLKGKYEGRVLSTRYLMGEVVFSVLSDKKPEAGFVQDLNPGLEDTYFANLYGMV